MTVTIMRTFVSYWAIKFVCLALCLQTRKDGQSCPADALQDVNVPIKWLSDLFDKYLPNTIFEMMKSFSHITPLGTMNFVTVSRPVSVQCPMQPTWLEAAHAFLIKLVTAGMMI